MPIHTIKTYFFNELNDKAKERALNEVRTTWEVSTRDLTDWLADNLKDKAPYFPTKDLRFSLGYCQGDGLAFYGDVDLAKLKEIEPHLFNEFKDTDFDLGLDAKCTLEKRRAFHLYDHFNTMEVSLDTRGTFTKKQEQAIDDLASFIQSKAREVSKELERMGYDYIDHETSDEFLSEEIQLNEMEFLESGERFFES